MCARGVKFVSQLAECKQTTCEAQSVRAFPSGEAVSLLQRFGVPIPRPTWPSGVTVSLARDRFGRPWGSHVYMCFWRTAVARRSGYPARLGLVLQYAADQCGVRGEGALIVR